MKNAIAFIVLLIIVSLFSVGALAQVRLKSAQVKEILVHNGSGGMLGGVGADIKVVAEDGQWHSYLIRKDDDLRMRAGDKPYDSTYHKLIATVDPVLLTNLLNGIAVIKPKITPSTFGLTAHQLITELKGGARQPIKKAPDFEKIITQKVIDKAIAESVTDPVIMDAFQYSELSIITWKNDTIKLSTRVLCPTKLPWTIGKHVTYDMAVNNFIIAAMGQENLVNKDVLSISSLKQDIYKYIDKQHTGDPIFTFKWNYYYPENLKLLSEYFTIREGISSGNVYSCTLKTKIMPANSILEATIDMTHKQDITALIKFAALIDKYLQTDNFVFKYYANRPNTQIDFSCYTGRSPYSSLQYLSKKLPELAQTDSTQVLNVLIAAPDDDSRWVIFPGDKTLLTYHSVTTANGEAAPIFPKQDPNENWVTRSYVNYLFDGAGKVLTQGARL